MANCRLGCVKTDSFYNLPCLAKVQLEANAIGQLEYESFNDVRTQYLYLKNNKIGRVENGAFNLSVADAASLTNNTIGDIQSEAFSLGSPKSFCMVENTVDTVYPHSFKMAAKNVNIEGNTLTHVTRRAFQRIEPANAAAKQSKLTLKNNTVRQFDGGCLDLNQLYGASMLQVVHLNLDVECACQLRLIDKLVQDNSRIRTVISDAIHCTVPDGHYTSLDDFELRTCRNMDMTESEAAVKTDIVIPISVSVVLFLVGIVTAVVYVKHCRKSKSASSPSPYPSSSGDVHARHNSAFQEKAFQPAEMIGMPANWIMAVPDTRLYKETELQVEVEFTTPLTEAAIMTVD